MAVDEHLARRRLLHRTGDGEQRALARAARAHDGDERARRDVEVDVDEGIDPAGALAVGLGHAAEVDGAHRRLPTCRRSRSGAVRSLGRRRRQRGGPALEAAVDAVEPADQRVEPEQLGVGDEQEAELVVAGVLLEPGVLLHQLGQLPAVDLQEGGDVDLREVEGDEHLDDELVPRRRRHVRGRAEPGLELLGPRRGQREDALRAGAVVVGVDEPVALEPLQGRVDLPDVERPHLAGAVLELLAELQPVLRSLAEQGEEGVADAHGRSASAVAYSVSYC